MSGCQEWQGARTAGGYGERTIDGTMVYVHRLTWEEVNGPIPEGMEVMHVCDNPACHLPAHLRLGTHAENMADMSAKGRGRKPMETLPARCASGRHLMVEHGYVRPDGRRRECRACRNAQQRRWRAR